MKRKGPPAHRVSFSQGSADRLRCLGCEKERAALANAHVYAGFPLGYIALLVGGLMVDPLVRALNRLRSRSEGAGAWATTTVLSAIPVAAMIFLAVKAASDAGGY